MSSVIVMGMEMPTRCLDCPFMIGRDNDDCILQSDEANAGFESWDDMKANCPLIPLPSEHGRLKDTTAFEAEIRKRYCEKCDRRFGTKNGKYKELYEIGDVPCRACWIADMLDELDAFDTIVDAERSGE